MGHLDKDLTFSVYAICILQLVVEKLLCQVKYKIMVWITVRHTFRGHGLLVLRDTNSGLLPRL